jgi:hypothetical protein
MMENIKNLSEIFQEKISRDIHFNLALSIVRDNCKDNGGEIWIIGGFLYKSLVELLYGSCENPPKDYDFIIEKVDEKIILPQEWERKVNRFGNPKFIMPSSEIEIDFVPIDKVYSVLERKIENPDINDYLNGVPLNIHSIAYNISEKRISGDIGIKALEEKTVRVNDLEMAKDAAELYDTTVNEMIRKKSEELGFKAEYVSEN